MVEYPGMVRVERNPARAGFGGKLGGRLAVAFGHRGVGGVIGVQRRL